MSIQQSTSTKAPTIKKVSQSMRFWLINFAVTAAISIVSSFTGHQSIFATAAMIIAAGMVVLRATKYDEMVEEERLVRISDK